MMIQHLFVYGTLIPGGPNEHVMTAIGGTWQKAAVRGYLKQEGWGAEMGYPGIILDEAGDEIEGYLFSSENLEAHWGTLDAFEGAEYERVLITVTTAEAEIEAYIYMLSRR